jgi:hypothetical protein
MDKGDFIVINSGQHYRTERKSPDVLIGEFDFPAGIATRFAEKDSIRYFWCNSVADPRRDYFALRTELAGLIRGYYRYGRRDFYFLSGFYRIILRIRYCSGVIWLYSLNFRPK